MPTPEPLGSAEATRSRNLGGVPLSKGMHLLLCLVALAWAGAADVLASKSAQGLSVRFHLGSFDALIAAVFLLFLVVVGLHMLDWIATRGRFEQEILPLPQRATASSEWGVGAAVGWGLSLAATLPLLLSAHLHARLNLQGASVLPILITMITILVASLAEEVIFRGFAFRRLIEAVGPSWAAVLLSLLFAAVLVLSNPPASVALSLLNETLFGVLLALAWLRTHGIWVGWGLHFARRAVTAAIFGLPVAGFGVFGSVADTFATGPRWLSGGAFGLDAALLTVPILLGGLFVLYRVTRQYAWEYTFPQLHPAGYAVAVAPPPAHAAMEKAAPPPPLVQILPSTPRSMEERSPDH